MNTQQLVSEKDLKELSDMLHQYNIRAYFITPYFYNIGHPCHNILKSIVKDCTNYLSVMTTKELELFIENLPEHLKSTISRRSKNDSEYLNIVSLRYVTTLLSHKRQLIKNIINVNENEVLKQLPELSEMLDKDGLLRVSSDFTLLERGLKYKDHFIYYHPFFFLASGNMDLFFIQIMKGMGKNSLNQLGIAYDPTRIIPFKWYERILMFDTWFGIKFDRNKIDDDSLLGLMCCTPNLGQVVKL